MKSPASSPIQRQQTKHQFANAQGYLNYELGNAVRRLPPLYTRVMIGGICVAVTGAVTWAAVSKVEEVATANGEVIPSRQVQPLRSLSAGSLQTINVTEGKPVKKGDVLIQLDPTQANVEVQRLQKLAKLNRDSLARLEAERTRKTQTGVGLQDELIASRLQEFRDRRAAAKADASRQLSTMRSAQVQKTRLEADLGYAATFPYQEYGMVEGTVSKISPNAVNEKDVGLVFPVQVQIKQRSVRVNGQDVPLTPGMATTAEIVTRQKTVLSFLLDPITASWDRAFSVR